MFLDKTNVQRPRQRLKHIHPCTCTRHNGHRLALQIEAVSALVRNKVAHGIRAFQTEQPIEPGDISSETRWHDYEKH